MKKIVLKLYEFDELSKDSQERIIEREHWNVMEQCMDAYGIDYKKSMKAFEDMTDTRVYNWEVGYERYDFSYEFKYKDPIYEHPTDYHRDIFPENLCGKLLFRYINNNIMPYIIKGKYFSTSGKYIDGRLLSLIIMGISMMPNISRDLPKPLSNAGRQTNQELLCWMKKNLHIALIQLTSGIFKRCQRKLWRD